MKQIWFYDDNERRSGALPLDVDENDIAQISPERLDLFNYFVVKLVPTTDIWKD